MEEEIQLPMTASLPKNTSSSSKIRFLGLLKQPDSLSNPFELEESDVIWSADLSDSPNVDYGDQSSPALSSVSNSSTSSRHSFRPDNIGLSAALSEDQRPVLQRIPSLNPSFSPSSTARTIIPVTVSVPVSAPRLASSSEELSSGSSYSRKLLQSAPVNVPVWPNANGGRGSGRLGYCHEEDEEAEEEMLPPHEIVARSHATTFSVFEGVGRTLKGRDLRRVRNAVWQKTGFLD